MITSRLILLTMRNVSGKNCRENQNTHFMFNNFFSQIKAIMRCFGKIRNSQTGRRSQCNTAHALCVLHN